MQVCSARIEDDEITLQLVEYSRCGVGRGGGIVVGHGTRSTDSSCAKLRTNIVEQGICRIVNLHGPDFTPAKHHEDIGVEYHHIRSNFETAISFAAEAGGPILIHCAQGRSRSVTIAIAYLMKVRRMCLADAFELIHSKRRCIHPNPGFQAQLSEFERELIEKDGLPVQKEFDWRTVLPGDYE